MSPSMDLQGFGLMDTAYHFYGNGIMSISQKNGFGETQEVFLSRDLALGLSILIKQRERMGIFNE